MLEAMKQGVYALEYAGEELRKDKEFVLEAVKQSCWALDYASEELLQNDEELKKLYEEYNNKLPF